jgi:TPR repeat protein
MLGNTVAKWIAILGMALPGVVHAQSDAPRQLVDAATQGDPINEWALGHFYLTSAGDRQKAYYWLKKAADDGQLNAKIELNANFAASGATPFGDALQSGIAARAAQARDLVKSDAPDTELVFFKADSDSPPQYMFYSPTQQKQVTVLDRNGTLQAGSPGPGTITAAVPGRFIDLPRALAAAKAQGLRGEIGSAVLMVAQPKGKAPVAVWTLMPVDATQHGNLGYFVGATDGKALGLMDVSDGINGNDAQLKAIQDALHPKVQAGGGSGGAMARTGGYNANAAYAESQRKAYDYQIFQNDPARAANCRANGC